MDHTEDLLRNTALFKGFPPAQLRNLTDQCEVRTFAPQEAIIRFGQPGRFLGVILDGRAEAVITNEMGDQQRIGTLKQGDFLGEISLLTGMAPPQDAVARLHVEGVHRVVLFVPGRSASGIEESLTALAGRVGLT